MPDLSSLPEGFSEHGKLYFKLSSDFFLDSVVRTT